MSRLALELWLGFFAAAVALGIGAYVLARKDDSLDWDTNRREDERRNADRRSGGERRSLSRLVHDRVHNPGRRRAERREGDRRREGEWQNEIEAVREKVEATKQDGPGR